MKVLLFDLKSKKNIHDEIFVREERLKLWDVVIMGHETDIMLFYLSCNHINIYEYTLFTEYSKEGYYYCKKTQYKL